MKQIAAAGFLLLAFSSPIIGQNTNAQEDIVIQSSKELTDEKLKQETEYYKAQAKKLNEKSFVSDTTWQVMIGIIPGILVVVIGGYITYKFNIKVVSREKEKIFNRLRKAVYLSVRELHEAVQRILEDWNRTGKRPQFLNGELIFNQPYTQKSNDPNDSYFQKYYLVDTAYLLCSVLGWLELYRQDLTFLRHDEDFDRKIDQGTRKLEESLFPGFEKIKKDKELHPILLPDEQRAIGEKMLVPVNNQMWIRGYASFSEQLFRLPEKGGMVINLEQDVARSQDFWIHIMTRFLTYTNYSDGYLKDRFNQLDVALGYLISTLDLKNNSDVIPK